MLSRTRVGLDDQPMRFPRSIRAMFLPSKNLHIQLYITLTIQSKLNKALLIPTETRFNIKSCCFSSLSIKVEQVHHRLAPFRVKINSNRNLVFITLRSWYETPVWFWKVPLHNNLKYSEIRRSEITFITITCIVIKVPLWSNSRYPFFLHFPTLKVFPWYLGKFQSITNIRTHVFGPLFPTVYGRHWFSLFQVLSENWRKWHHILKNTTQVVIIVTINVENCTNIWAKVFVILYANWCANCYYNFNPCGIFENMTRHVLQISAKTWNKEN